MGTHTDLVDVEYFQTRKAVVRSEEEVPVEVDGEVITRLPVTFRISSRKLKVLAPKPHPRLTLTRSSREANE